MESILEKGKIFQRFTFVLGYCKDRGVDLCVEDSKKTFSNGGFEPIFYIWTFYFDDMSEGLACLEWYDHIPRYLCLTAPADRFDEAVQWAKDANPNLQFGEIKKGHNGDDFVCNRLSAQIYFTLKESA